jgi:hypothetical protein
VCRRIPRCDAVDETKSEAGGDQFVQVHVARLGGHVTRIVEDFVQQPLDAMDVLNGDLAEFTDEHRVLLALRSQLNKGLDRREGVTDFMRKPARHNFQRA